jgi:hypothetical protein
VLLAGEASKDIGMRGFRVFDSTKGGFDGPLFSCEQAELNSQKAHVNHPAWRSSRQKWSRSMRRT